MTETVVTRRPWDLRRRRPGPGATGARRGWRRRPGPGAAEAQRIWDGWLALWSGNTALGAELLAERVTVHSPKLSEQLDPSTLVDREKALAMIGAIHAMTGLEYTSQAGPVAQGDLIAGAWTYTGTYRGGLPGATAAPGTPVTNEGVYLLRHTDGRVHEWWSAADNMGLLLTLGLLRRG
ncbi:ester cyclase [Streptomyces sp. NPDC050560]|uniref:ester cyclase n=1 Tax=Streptomyces sp. NPDC050560 TaxID=3365630 RepID=UPI0037BA1EC4